MSARLAERAADWVPIVFPNGRRDDEGHWRVADIAGRAPGVRGSCVIFMHGDHAGGWHDFAPYGGVAHGGPLSTIAERLGLSGRELFARAAELVGEPGNLTRGMPERKTPKPPKDYSTEIAHILRHATPIAGSLAETYLRARAITIPIGSPDLRFNGNVTDWRTRSGMPCLVAVLRYPNGSETGGVHRIYLNEDGSFHAGKKALGAMDGAVVMLSPIGERMGIGEGIESTLAGMQLFGLPGWATASADNMRKLGDFLAHYGAGIIRELVIFADRGKAGQDAALHLGRCARSVGIDAVIALPIGDDDFADDLKNGRGRSDITLPIDDPQPEPQSEIIEPTRFADVMAAVRGIQRGNSTTVSRALEMLSRCADADPLKIKDVFDECKNLGGYPISTIREMYALFEARNAPTRQAVSDAPGWRSELITRDSGEPYGNLANVCMVLRGKSDFLQPDGSSVFALNEFTNFPMLQGAACWEPITAKKQIGFGRPVTDDDIRGITEQVQRLGIPASENVALSAVMRVAIVKKYHPVRSFLLDCKSSWDRQARLDKLLPYYAGIDAGDKPLTEKQLRLPIATGSRFCIGAVARALQPGVKMDTALILEGIQGIGKSTFFEILFGEEFFTDQISDLGSKDSSLEMAGVWCVELSELDAMGRAEVSRIKRFLSQRKDRFRAPYARTVGEHPRGCVFAGTTNEAEYLRDATGGRRFWTHLSHMLRLEELKRDRVHLWGEAVTRYEAGEPHWLHEADLIDDAAWEARERTVADPWLDKIGGQLEWLEQVTLDQVWGMIPIAIEADRDPVKLKRLIGVLHRLGWHQVGQIRDPKNPHHRPRTYRRKAVEREPGQDA
jgi:putative DNA primase/helicase